MGDLKTTAEERAKMRMTYKPGGYYGIPGASAAKLLDDLDTLLAENAEVRLKLEAMHRRAQTAEGELAKIGGEPGGLAFLRNEHYRRGDVDTENARLRAEVERLREILAPRGLVELEPTVAESAARVVSERDEAEARGAKLDVVAARARDACNIHLNDAGPQAFATIAELRAARAALEAP